MKHVKDIILERRNFKDYRKYESFLKKKFSAYKLEIFAEEGTITIRFSTGGMHRDELKYFDEYLKGSDYTIYGGNHQLDIDITASKEFMDQVDLELDTSKYNL